LQTARPLSILGWIVFTRQVARYLAELISDQVRCFFPNQLTSIPFSRVRKAIREQPLADGIELAIRDRRDDHRQSLMGRGGVVSAARSGEGCFFVG
jgi:hypothetical protein